MNIPKQLSDLIGKVTGLFAQEIIQIASNRLLEYQLQEYARCSATKTMLHRIYPVPLKRFYQPLSLEQKKNSERISTESYTMLAKSHQYLTILGSAGSGKSTLLKYLFVDCYESGYKIPLKIEFRHLNSFAGTLADFVFNEIFLFQKLGISTEIVERMLNSGDFALFFDGFDELDSNKISDVYVQFDAFVKRFPSNSYIVTSRPYTSIEMLPLFDNLKIGEMSREEVVLFIQKQVDSVEKELATKIIHTIETSKNDHLDSFLKNPLLLSMFILTFQAYSTVPLQLNEFYFQVFEALFSLHDVQSKMNYERERRSRLPKGELVGVLECFAFLSYFESAFAFSKSYINEKFNLIKREIQDTTKFDNDNLILDLKVSIGIFVEDGSRFAFSHASLQEYFASRYIKGLSEKNKIAFFRNLIENIYEVPFLVLRHRLFLQLMWEIDKRSATKYFIVPFLTFLIQKILLIKPKNRQEEFKIFQLIVWYYSTVDLDGSKINVFHEATMKYFELNLNINNSLSRNYALPIEIERKVDWQLIYGGLIHFKELMNDHLENIGLNLDLEEDRDSRMLFLVGKGPKRD
ncbi:NACHT domain-containing protein [Dyadobacter arcticus]|uniref:NACHT family NTPase n=1 Tax=Dyadobacter arcticus TaxID=1078754 RepID=A0ABX0UT83_9BACT|nr:NACHT domain-containing protein [Dyadobacter arcticus]NIJ56178.1 putative NACHT family NTPase [Dyadobacter arcticus]